MLTLYSTSGCHLCEMAFSQLQQLNLGDKVDVVDIAFDDELFSSYGVTIPVLAFTKEYVEKTKIQNMDYQAVASERTANPKETLQPIELFWPFNIEELQVWLKQNGIN
ncbi:glutaredoxin family protein [Vibrio hibernica]|uniref:glutaredoxin family protein n=1 Tax=Vibrio hibernica TaxID=2587465 RepID=UPI00187FAC1E|nr:glutaredoxin family protein [Vibrio hibernica]